MSCYLLCILQNLLTLLHQIHSFELGSQGGTTLLTQFLISVGGGEWDSGAGVAGDTWTDGADAGANAGGDFGTTNHEITEKVAGGGGDFTCRR